MKMLVDRIPASGKEPFVIEEVQDHLRVGDEADTVALVRTAWAAAREIENFGQIALLKQTIRVTIFDPDLGEGLHLPVGPALGNDGPTVTFDGQAVTAFQYVGGQRPYIRWAGDLHHAAPGQVVIEYVAGFGAFASDVPSDIATALVDQAALLYDGRSPMDARSLTSSPHMARIAARYRGVQA